MASVSHRKRGGGLTPLFSLAMFLPVLIFICMLLAGLGLGGIKTAEPRLYAFGMSKLLGLEERKNYSLSSVNISDPELMGLLESEKIDSVYFADVAAALKWLAELEPADPNVGFGMPLIIPRHESGNRSNMGNDWAYEQVCAPYNVDRLGQRFCDGERAAMAKLLAHMKKFNVREKDPVAREYLNATYTNYRGAKSGELGGNGFIASTAWKVCEEALSKSDDLEVASCNYWSPKVAAFATVYYLWDIGYREDLSYEENVTEMWGWNHLESYRRTLVSEADEMNALLAGKDLSFAVNSSPVITNYSEPKLFILGFMKEFGILPGKMVLGSTPSTLGTQEWMKVPLNGSLGLTQPFKPTSHIGVDWGCSHTAEVLAVADGWVADPEDPKFKIDSLLVEDRTYGWGIVLFVHHGGRLHSSYFHFEEIYVQYGQFVKKGDVLGKCGYTGYSYDRYGVYNQPSSRHLHFSVIITEEEKPIIGPASMVNKVWRDPMDFLGETIDPYNLP